MLAACGEKAATSCPTGYVCTPAQSAGVTTLASEIQQLPTTMVSDGTTLFWICSDASNAGIQSMPVSGGTIRTAVPGGIGGTFLAVDGSSLFYIDAMAQLCSAPKSGGRSPTILSDSGAIVGGAAVLGTSIYWLERPSGSGPIGGKLTLKTALLSGGRASTVTDLSTDGPQINGTLGVTQTTAFVSGFPAQLASFELASGVPDGGMPTPVSGGMVGCEVLLSDTNAVYCDTGSSVLAITSDGMTKTLGNVIDGNMGGILSATFDDTYVYWVDTTMVGSIMKAPKTGGSVTTLARDTSPTAIAVDAKSVYWADQGGLIESIPK